MWNDSEFNSTFASPGGNGRKDPKKAQIRYILPVTCETINQSNQVEGENSVFEYRHLKFHHLKLIGIIRSVIKHVNDITYIVDDMTSTGITVKLQSDESEELENDKTNGTQTRFIENQYVKVYGVLKSLQGQKYVQAFRILPIKELNEITYHILAAMHASIFYSNKSNNFGSDRNATTSEYFNGVTSGSNPLKASNLNGDIDANKSNNGLSGIYMQVSNVIKQNKSNSGVHVKDICAYFKNLPESKIREALDFLCLEGHIYTTFDDEHFRSTDGF